MGAKIEEMITSFEAHEVMRRPKTTIAVLQEVKSSFDIVRNNINNLDAKVLPNLVLTVFCRKKK